jgi:peptide-methionine (S)-S-oxide reductase
MARQRRVLLDDCTGSDETSVWFDPAQVSYGQLLETFWRIHNPTTRNRQGWDIGSQYRSAIFYHGADQQELAVAARDAEQHSLRRQIVTEITPAAAFYRAEEYHQRYLEKHGRATCAVTIG